MSIILLTHAAGSALAAQEGTGGRAGFTALPALGRLCVCACICACVMLAVALPSGVAHAKASVASLSNQKPALEAVLEQIEADRLAFQKDLAKQEEACLKRFFSARCMDKIRTEHITQMRTFDLKREEAQQQIRDLDAQMRQLQRQERIEERDAKQQKQGGK